MIVIDEFDIIQGSIFTITDAYFGILVSYFKWNEKVILEALFFQQKRDWCGSKEQCIAVRLKDTDYEKLNLLGKPIRDIETLQFDIFL